MASHIERRKFLATLGGAQGFVVPKGVIHRTRAPEKAVILMVETTTIVPTGDA
jgi:mannose-6-phosphate isomerase-like protein (cupin superfamily)